MGAEDGRRRPSTGDGRRREDQPCKEDEQPTLLGDLNTLQTPATVRSDLCAPLNQPAVRPVGMARRPDVRRVGGVDQEPAQQLRGGRLGGEDSVRVGGIAAAKS